MSSFYSNWKAIFDFERKVLLSIIPLIFWCVQMCILKVTFCSNLKAVTAFISFHRNVVCATIGNHNVFLAKQQAKQYSRSRFYCSFTFCWLRPNVIAVTRAPSRLVPIVLPSTQAACTSGRVWAVKPLTPLLGL